VGPAPALPIPAPAFDAAAPADAIVDLTETKNWACATRKSGHVDCWGDSDALVRLPDIADATKVRGNDFHRCVLRRTEITCFSTGYEKKPPLHVAIDGAIEAHVGYPSCAVRADHTLACWDEDTGEVTHVREEKDVITLDGNGYVVCALHGDGKVRCTDELMGSHVWRSVALDHVRALAIGDGGADNGDFYTNGCVLRDDGTARCFQLEGHETHPIRVAPYGDLDVSGVKGATTLVMEEAGTLAMIVDGHVLLASEHEAPHPVPRIADAVQVTPHCALRAQGSVVCWGDRNTGQPARGRADSPVPVVGVADVVSLGSNERIGWAVTRDGHVYHWGEGDPGWALQQPEAHDTAAVAVGASVIAEPCFLRRDGGVTCLSYRTHQPTDMKLAHVVELHDDGEPTARLADGSLRYWMMISIGEPDFELTVVPGIAGAVQIAGGLGTLCARDGAGRVLCEQPSCTWDHTGHWKCVETTPHVVAIPPARQLARSYDTVCALLATGEVSCWNDKEPPARIAGLSHAVAISATEKDVCAEISDGRLWCWQTRGDRTPRQVLPAGSLDGPVTGGADGCTIRKDGLVACWGSNEYGRLGDGSIMRLDSPAAVPGLQ
jgi:hypothetical protein